MKNDTRRLAASGAAALLIHLGLIFGAGRLDFSVGSPPPRQEPTELYLLYQAETRQEDAPVAETSPRTPPESPPAPQESIVPVEEVPDPAPVEEASAPAFVEETPVPVPVEKAPAPALVEEARPARVAEARKSVSRPKPAGETAASRREAGPETGRREEVSSPQPLQEFVNSKPVYPELARQRGQEGLVILGVDVDERGNAVRVAVRHSSGFSLLDDAALKRVGRWRFRPAKVAGRSVAGHVLVPVEFRLK
ncbi:MAG: energy transducer TonB [Desulfovibrio sp.]|jgi:protein TonB|nr:energy transducer TonB [Desulfovibrio sp.]